MLWRLIVKFWSGTSSHQLLLKKRCFGKELKPSPLAGRGNLSPYGERGRLFQPEFQ